MKKDYMTRLERAARWRLPPKEADDVVADYREMVGDPPRPEEELLRELGRPRDAVRPLTQKRPYRIWLAVFLVLSAYILTLGFSGTGPGFHFWRLYFDGFFRYTKYYLSLVVTALSVVVLLVWFRWQGRKTARLPQAIPILLAILLAWCGGVMLYCWAFSRDFDGFLDAWGTMPALLGPNAGKLISVSLYLPQNFMVYGSALLSLAGVVWLVKARTGDRRWAAVYILALAAILTSLLCVHRIWNMDIDLIFAPEVFFRQLLYQCSVITAVGMIGAGVALC